MINKEQGTGKKIDDSLTGTQKLKWNLIFFAGLIVLIGGLILGASAHSAVINVIAAVGGLFLMFYAIRLATKMSKAHFNTQAGELQPRLDAALTACERSSALLSVPPAYRYSFAMESMLQLVQNRRANTWVECADKYEEMVHRLQVQQSLEEIQELSAISAYYTMQAAKNARAAAIFSGLNFFLR